MKLLVINGTRFVSAFKYFGHKITSAGCNENFDISLPVEEFSIPNILEKIDFEPDAIIVELFGYRPFVANLASTKIPVIAYLIDSSLNSYWVKYYAHLFDLLLVDHLPDVEFYRKHNINSKWFPLSVNEKKLPETKYPRTFEHDITFVGRFSQHRKKRRAIVDLLSKDFNLHVAGGDGDKFLRPVEMYKLFSRSKIVLNENLFDGWTMRIFEGAASGSCVFSEKVGKKNGDIFEDKKHLSFYGPENFREKADFLLNNKEIREEQAIFSRQEVLTKHTHQHRAAKIIELLKTIDTSTRQNKKLWFRQAMEAKAYHFVMLRWPETVDVLVRRCEGLAKTVLAKDKMAAEMLLLLGKIYGQWTKDISKSIKALNESYQLDKNNNECRMALYEILLRTDSKTLANNVIHPILEKSIYKDSFFDQQSFIWRVIGDFLNESGSPYFVGYSPCVEDLFPVTAIQYYFRALKSGDEEAWWKSCELSAEYGDTSGAFESGLALSRKYALSEERIQKLLNWAYSSYNFDEALKLSSSI